MVASYDESTCRCSETSAELPESTNEVEDVLGRVSKCET